MADTYTSNYNFTKPEPGVAGWDGKLNADMDAIDTEIQNREDEINAEASARAAAIGDLSGVTDPVTARQNLGAVGKQTMWIPAQAMLPTVSNGCSPLTQVELTAGQPDLFVLDFDPAATEYAQFQVAMPKQWDKGDVSYQIFWTAGTVEANDVIWTLEGVAIADDAPIDVAYGTAISITDTFLSAANDLMVSAESAALTIAGNPANANICIFRFGRDASNVADTYGSDARLIGIKLFFNNNTGNDA